MARVIVKGGNWKLDNKDILIQEQRGLNNFWSIIYEEKFIFQIQN